MHDFLATSPFTEPVPQGFLIIIEGKGPKYEEIQHICHQTRKILMISILNVCIQL